MTGQPSLFDPEPEPPRIPARHRVEFLTGLLAGWAGRKLEPGEKNRLRRLAEGVLTAASHDLSG